MYANSVKGYGRGFELLLLRTSVNNWNGWVSYAYGRTMLHEGMTNQTFPGDYDQRHTVNAYVSYRIRPTVNLSARWAYGSGFPVPAYVQSRLDLPVTWAAVYAVGAKRNQ